MYIVKAGVDPLWEMAHAAKTAIKLMDGLGNSTPSDDFKSMATKIEMFVTRMVKFISQDRWRSGHHRHWWLRCPKPLQRDLHPWEVPR